MQKSISSKIILFILNPFIAAIHSFINIRDGRSLRILYLWFLLFGICFCANNEAADSFRYVEDFYVESRYTPEQYFSIIKDYFSFDTNIKDIYTLSVHYLVGKFTDNYHWVFFVYSIIFGFFYIGSLRIFLRLNFVDNKWVFFLLLFLFCYSNPIFNINGVRFWTASWIGVYAGLKIFVDHKYKYFFLLFITPLIHGTFPIWVALVLCAFFTGQFERVWKVLFVLSSFFSAVSFLSLLDGFEEYLPTFMQNQIWSYTQSEKALAQISGEVLDKQPLYAQIFNALPRYFNLLVSYIIIFNSKIFTKDFLSERIFLAFGVLVTTTNFLSSIPSVHRYQQLVIPFMVILWALNYEDLKKYDKIFYLIPFIFSYSIFYWLIRTISISEIYLYVCPAPISIIYYLL